MGGDDGLIGRDRALHASEARARRGVGPGQDCAQSRPFARRAMDCFGAPPKSLARASFGPMLDFGRRGGDP